MVSCVLQTSMILLLLDLVSSTSNWVPDVPPECEMENVCDVKISNYPKRALINRSIRKLQKEGYVIGLEKDSFDPPSYLGHNDSELCRSEFRKIIPRAAKDAETNEWRFVINGLYKPVQVIIVEVCSEQDAPCDKLDSKSFIVRHGYQARCVQRFFHKALLGYNETGHVIHFRARLLPMCCACVAAKL